MILPEIREDVYRSMRKVPGLIDLLQKGIVASDIDGCIAASAGGVRVVAPFYDIDSATSDRLRELHDATPVCLVTGQPNEPALEVERVLKIACPLVVTEHATNMRIGGAWVRLISQHEHDAVHFACDAAAKLFENSGAIVRPNDNTVNAFWPTNESFDAMRAVWDDVLEQLWKQVPHDLAPLVKIPPPNPIDRSANIFPATVGKKIFTDLMSSIGIPIVGAIGDSGSDAPLLESAQRWVIVCHDDGIDTNAGLRGIAKGKRACYIASSDKPHGYGLAEGIAHVLSFK